jgi:2-polyprenyl-6-methoxyphenol hydroxylase-like FAD-dependent oxidoreductase
MEGRSAIVVGAGLGGLTAGLALRRAGFDVEVFERRSELGEVNTGLSLWGFAIARLAELGLDSPDDFGSPIERLVHRTAADEPLTDLPVPVGRGVSYDVHRGELQMRLADAFGRDRITLGVGCVGVRERPLGAEAEFDDGRRARADVLIGADGVGSTVRPSVVGPVRLRREAIGVWRGIARVGVDELPRGVHLRFLGDGALFGIGRLSDDTIRWYAGAAFPSESPKAGEDAKALATRVFAGWPERVMHTLARTPASDFLFNDTPHARPLTRWRSGHTVLLGDAAHPMLPTLGVAGGVAIEDSAVLGECLTAEADIPTALRTYERRRRPAAWRITLAARGFERAMMVGGPLQRFRDPAFRIAPQQLALRWLTAGGRFE